MPKIALCMATLGDGGVGRLTLLLTRRWCDMGIDVDLLLGRTTSPYMGELDARVGVFCLGTSNPFFSTPRVAMYLHRKRPNVILSDSLRMNRISHGAKALARSDVRVYTAVHIPMGVKEGLLPPRKRGRYRRQVVRSFNKNHGIIAVSHGVAQNLVTHFPIPFEKVRVIYNPIVCPELFQKAREPVAHSWFTSKDVPVILAAGRFEPQKAFLTLIRAFYELQKWINARLVILGDGKERCEMEALIAQLGLQECVSLPGFVLNPYPYMANADLFVLSSAWEGFGIVLVEAMAMGTPVVSTDCCFGPSEILENGRLGPLVAVGDTMGLAMAMRNALLQPVARDELIRAAERFSDEVSAKAYVEYLELLPRDVVPSTYAGT